ncbi:hypothetical protein [Uliginosibacterium aquaticum]|uniref:Uncharacterized protein n=1 Tax=Uliginosibacterium aquaticum TaxID=2731212 RepID=A0ABX2IPE3_9RHOO|nr:hypothetical protein [Uliginosibacterium aquaticum]NSL56892.1 hypothetical protein [Uliginosibacterium aquaticum]
MQHATRNDDALTTTCFDLEGYEVFANKEEYPATLALTTQTAVAANGPIDLPAIPTVCLSQPPAPMRLDNWRLVLVRGVVEAITPNHIVGSAVQIPKGRTSPIAAFDPLTRRVRTHSGSVYELGIPEMSFERVSPEVMRCLGF